eukprot:4859351-Amphidinium_carterae.1
MDGKKQKGVAATAASCMTTRAGTREPSLSRLSGTSTPDSTSKQQGAMREQGAVLTQSWTDWQREKVALRQQQKPLCAA